MFQNECVANTKHCPHLQRAWGVHLFSTLFLHELHYSAVRQQFEIVQLLLFWVLLLMANIYVYKEINKKNKN